MAHVPPAFRKESRPASKCLSARQYPATASIVRGHVLRSPDHQIRCSQAGIVRAFRLFDFCDSKVQAPLHSPYRTAQHHYVFRSSDRDGRRLRCERLRAHHLPAENFDCSRERHGTFLPNDLLQRLPVQVFHHQKHHPVFGFTEIGNT